MMKPVDVITTEFAKIDDRERIKISLHLYRKRLRQWAIVGAAGAVLLVIGAVLMEKALMFAGVFMLFAGVGDNIAVRFAINRANLDPANKLVQQPWRGIFTAEKVTFEAQDGSLTSLPWSAIIKVEKL